MELQELTGKWVVLISQIIKVSFDACEILHLNIYFFWFPPLNHEFEYNSMVGGGKELDIGKFCSKNVTGSPIVSSLLYSRF